MSEDYDFKAERAIWRLIEKHEIVPVIYSNGRVGIWFGAVDVYACPIIYEGGESTLLGEIKADCEEFRNENGVLVMDGDDLDRLLEWKHTVTVALKYIDTIVAEVAASAVLGEIEETRQ